MEHLATNAVVLSFCWIMGLILALSSSNLRREQLNYTLGTMGIMAHELRTPLATIALIGDAVRNEASRSEADSAEVLEKLSDRLHITVRNMNHQIDSQIANARLMRLPTHQETVSAAALVREAVDGLSVSHAARAQLRVGSYRVAISSFAARMRCSSRSSTTS